MAYFTGYGQGRHITGEDDVLVLRALSVSLEDEGYTVASGKEAIAQCRVLLRFHGIEERSRSERREDEQGLGSMSLK